MDSPPHFLYALLCISTAVFTAYSLSRFIPSRNTGGSHHHFSNLDGLRGFLSLFLLLGHAAVWQNYLKDNTWKLTNSAFYTHLGQTGIVIFFMLTGFLFAQKLLDDRENNIDWLRLYCSRALRLIPAYWVAMATLLAITFAIGPTPPLTDRATPASAYLSWLLFTIPGAPPLHGATETGLIMTMATWTLTFGWAFYLLLPFLGVLFRVKVSVLTLVICGLAFLWTFQQIPNYWLVYGMLATGCLAAIIQRAQWINRWAKSPLSGLIVIALILANVAIQPTAYTALSVAIIGCAFLLIACGSSIFGLLNRKTSQILGLGAYGMYLYHGPLLYLMLHFAQSKFPGFYQSDEKFWLFLALVIAPMLVVTSLISYLFIEAPALQRTAELTHKLRALLRLPVQARTTK